MNVSTQTLFKQHKKDFQILLNYFSDKVESKIKQNKYNMHNAYMAIRVCLLQFTYSSNINFINSILMCYFNEIQKSIITILSIFPPQFTKVINSQNYHNNFRAQIKFKYSWLVFFFFGWGVGVGLMMSTIKHYLSF